MELVQELITFASPFISGVVTTILIPLLIKKQSIKSLETKINEITPNAAIRKVADELKEIKKEILEMRGKIK